MYSIIGKLVPPKYLNQVEKHLSSAGLDYNTEEFVGFLILIPFLFALITSIGLFYIPSVHDFFYNPIWDFLTNKGIFNATFTDVLTILSIFLLDAFLVYLITYTTVNAILILKKEARRKAVELALPDFLTLISSNIRAGMPLDQAMWYAAKPEFGVLSEEVKVSIKSAFSGDSFANCLNRLGKKFDSPVLTRTLTLLIQASESGGEVAKVLEITSEDIRNSALLKKEISASLLIYEIFILFSSSLGSPFLLGVVSKLLEVMKKSFEFLPSNQSFLSSASIIKPSDFYLFSLIAIFITIFFSSFIVGIIKTGSKKEGIKYFPFMLVVAYVVFFLTRAFLTSLLSGIIL